MKIVQVTSEAKARPIMTALTITSADMNIDHGDNSRSARVVDFSGVRFSAGVAVAAGAAGAAAVVAAGAGTGTVACGGLAGGCEACAAGWATVAGDGPGVTARC